MATRKKSKLPDARRAAEALARYQSMRDFSVTAEPRGKARAGLRSSPSRAPALPFVVQKHAATRLHYDFRLGWNGVLKSWAVTKGPSYFPGDKRLAVQVEDHPIEYGDFEGTIPKGQYGGGTVMVWDTGTWEPHGDFDRGLVDGHLKFELHGKKLKGSWALVRMHGRAGGSGQRQLAPDQRKGSIRDEKAQRRRLSTRLRIALQAAARWSRLRTATVAYGTRPKKAGRKQNLPRKTGEERPQQKTLRNGAAKLSVNLSSVPRERFPGFIAPQLAATR